MKIIFMGTPEYATAILQGLLDSSAHEVVALFTQEDKPVGRKKVLTPPHVKAFLLEQNLNIPIFQPKNLKSEEVVQSIQNLSPDVIVVAAYGQILTREVLNLAPCINLHASLLPKYRGASPIQSAILDGESYSGVTAMLMEEGLDTGDMLGFSYVKLTDTTTSLELFEKLSKSAKDLTLKVLEKFNAINPLKQQWAMTNYAPKIKKEDGEVELTSLHVKDIQKRFCAYTPWPGVFLPNKIKLLDFSLHVKQHNEALKSILSISKEEVKVAGVGGELVLKEVQPPSKNKMSAYSYILGQRKSVGDLLY